MRFSGVGVQMVITMILCWWLGEKAETKNWINSPWGQVFGIFFGVFSSMYHLIKSVSKY